MTLQESGFTCQRPQGQEQTVNIYSGLFPAGLAEDPGGSQLPHHRQAPLDNSKYSCRVLGTDSRTGNLGIATPAPTTSSAGAPPAAAGRAQKGLRDPSCRGHQTRILSQPGTWRAKGTAAPVRFAGVQQPQSSWHSRSVASSVPKTTKVVL